MPPHRRPPQHGGGLDDAGRHEPVIDEVGSPREDQGAACRPGGCAQQTVRTPPSPGLHERQGQHSGQELHDPDDPQRVGRGEVFGVSGDRVRAERPAGGSEEARDGEDERPGADGVGRPGGRGHARFIDHQIAQSFPSLEQ